MIAEPDASSWAEIRRWRKAMRDHAMAERLALSPEARRHHAEAVTALIRPMLGAETIGFYWPFKGEYDPRPLVTDMHAAGATLALPVVVAKAQPLMFRSWAPGERLVNGVWDIPIPADGEAVRPDVLLVPALGWDRACYRLGYGGGFYDRTLAAADPRPRTIGISHTALELKTVYPQAHDIRLGCFVTEAGVFSTA